MLNIVIMLISTMNSEPFNSNNYRIAKHLLEHIYALEDISIGELAKQCYVSNSSISRFCKDIGLDDFNDLKRQIAKYHVIKSRVKEKFDFENADEEKPVESFIDSVIKNLNLLKYSLHKDDISDLVEDIYNYKYVAAFGYLQSQSVALDLQYDLQTSGKHIHTSMKYTEQLEYFESADEEHLIIIFSLSGSYFQRSLQRKNAIKKHKHKPKIYLITANEQVDLPFVDEYIRYKSGTGYTSHPYAMIAIAGLISYNYAIYCDEHEPDDKMMEHVY